MSARGRWILAFLLAVAGSGVLGSLSRAPWTPPGATASTVRLSWRATSQRIEACRPLTESERRRLPTHMQQEQVCEGTVAPYLLRVWIDGALLTSDTVHASGARSDRPIYILREYTVRAGERDLRVEFVREEPAAAAAAAPAEEERPGSGFPASLELRQRVRAIPGRAALITYDADARALVVRTAGG